MHDTYYVVAQLGLNNLFSIYNYYATDYMLGTEGEYPMYCLLYINTFYLYKQDVSRNNILLNSKNNDTQTQSAKNCKGFSETERQLPLDNKF